MIGEAGHLLTGRIDALVLCGMQDGAMASTQDSLITEDDQRKAEEDAQKATDKAIKEIDVIAAAKEKGLVRSEGKEYVMNDGDVVLFRFNV